jgi:hypothetical protein
MRETKLEKLNKSHVSKSQVTVPMDCYCGARKPATTFLCSKLPLMACVSTEIHTLNAKV